MKPPNYRETPERSPAAVIWYNLDKAGVKTRSLEEAKDPDLEVQS